MTDGYIDAMSIISYAKTLDIKREKETIQRTFVICGLESVKLLKLSFHSLSFEHTKTTFIKGSSPGLMDFNQNSSSSFFFLRLAKKKLIRTWPYYNYNGLFVWFSNFFLYFFFFALIQRTILFSLFFLAYFLLRKKSCSELWWLL